MKIITLYTAYLWLFHAWFEETVAYVASFSDNTLKEKVQ